MQPTGPPKEWTSPPFEPPVRAGRLYGRGVADDKAGVAMHLAVLRALGGKPSVGVVLLVEGEEEIDSPTLGKLIGNYRDRLRADVVVVADSENVAVDVPTFTTSVRGVVDLSVEVTLLASAVHSGVFGGPAGDALTALCRLLATLHAEDGTVAVSGLRVDSSETPDVEEAAFRVADGRVPTARLLGRGSINDRRWHQPALAVIGIDSPSTEAASSVLLPRARAKLSLPLAPGEHIASAAKALTVHLLEHAPWGAEVTVTEDSWGEPYAFDATGDVYELARSVFADAYGNEAVDLGLGGSIPFIAEFTRAFPSSTVPVTGVGDPGSRWHGFDESLDLGMWEKTCLAELLLLQGLAGRR